MTRQERRKLQYNYVLNITGDTALARDARDWGQKRLLEETGIVLPEKVPRRTPPTKERKQKLRDLQQAKIKYAERRGISEENAKTMAVYTYKQINLQLQYDKKYKLKGKVSKSEQYTRMDDWGDYARQQDYPPLVERQAYLINLRNNLDINASYGFAIMYYHFTTNQSIEHLLSQYSFDRVTGVIIYDSLSKVR